METLKEILKTSLMIRVRMKRKIKKMKMTML
jgi:hypothetical protein